MFFTRIFHEKVGTTLRKAGYNQQQKETWNKEGEPANGAATIPVGDLLKVTLPKARPLTTALV